LHTSGRIWQHLHSIKVSGDAIAKDLVGEPGNLKQKFVTAQNGAEHRHQLMQPETRYKSSKFGENRTRGMRLRGVNYPSFGKLSVKILVFRLLYP